MTMRKRPESGWPLFHLKIKNQYVIKETEIELKKKL